MYNIKCTVSGGVTGYRTSLLKGTATGGTTGVNGRVKEFATLELAQAECDRLMASMNNAHSTASFSYVPVPVEEEL
jgi:hypothetical protein